MGRLTIATGSVALVLAATLASCDPPAPREAAKPGVMQATRDRPSAPIESPDTKGAIWAGGERDALLYGKPGEPPLLSLVCHSRARLDIMRHAPADAGAKALMAMLGAKGNARLPVDSVTNGETSLWLGQYRLDNRELDVLTSSGPIEVTIPGAGSLILNASDKPGDFLTECRAPA